MIGNHEHMGWKTAVAAGALAGTLALSGCDHFGKTEAPQPSTSTDAQPGANPSPAASETSTAPTPGKAVVAEFHGTLHGVQQEITIYGDHTADARYARDDTEHGDGVQIAFNGIACTIKTYKVDTVEIVNGQRKIVSHAQPSGTLVAEKNRTKVSVNDVEADKPTADSLLAIGSGACNVAKPGFKLVASSLKNFKVFPQELWDQTVNDWGSDEAAARRSALHVPLPELLPVPEDTWQREEDARLTGN